MDAVWAPVIAVFVTFAGSAVIPWVREAIDRRRKDREKASRNLDAAMEKLLLASLESSDAGTPSPSLREAAARLYVDLPADSNVSDRLLKFIDGEHMIFPAWEAREIVRAIRTG